MGHQVRPRVRQSPVRDGAQAPDRTKPPVPGPPPALKVPAIQKRTLTNGVPVWIMEMHEVPLVQVNLVVLAGSADDHFRKILGNNIVSNHWLANLVLPEMAQRKDGAVIIVSSIGGLKGTSVLGAYAISKAADMQLARNLAAEYGPDNIRVNAVCPVMGATGLIEQFLHVGRPEGQFGKVFQGIHYRP
mgnify:CR=1 FL=1